MRGPIPLQVNVITEDASLEVGSISETITVEAGGAPLVETETGQQGTVMDFKTISELPQSGGGITGADWASFNIYLPGAGRHYKRADLAGRGRLECRRRGFHQRQSAELRQLPSGRGQHLTAGELQQRR